MGLEQLVRQAARGDVNAFVELTAAFSVLRFRFGSFIDPGLPASRGRSPRSVYGRLVGIAEPGRPGGFSGWLRGIVRRQAFRVLRRRHFEALPLTAADKYRAINFRQTIGSTNASRLPPSSGRSQNCPQRCGSRRRSSTFTNARTRISRLFSEVPRRRSTTACTRPAPN
jgi:hypothetical protein